jgi:hypothetical protein
MGGPPVGNISRAEDLSGMFLSAWSFNQTLMGSGVSGVTAMFDKRYFD